MAGSKKILICVLDWGLGHATRCIPIILELQNRGAEVIIASSGSALELLKLEFPKNVFIDLPGYNPGYQSSGLLSMAMIRQLLGFRRVISNENRIIQTIVRQYSIDIIISDNRYGCWSSQVKSVLITHQTNLLMPHGFQWMAFVVNSILHRYIRKFGEVWIPDTDGALTYPFRSTANLNQKYIGWLSRFKKTEAITKRYDLIAIVSGPEPQRSVFENLLRLQLKSLGLKSLLVTGEPGRLDHTSSGDIEIINHLPADLLGRAIQAADVVISRSGYSTVMDMIALGKEVIFVPTPQQPEQLFLAKFLYDSGVAFSVRQNEFDIVTALKKRTNFEGFSRYEMNGRYLSRALDSLLL